MQSQAADRPVVELPGVDFCRDGRVESDPVIFDRGLYAIADRVSAERGGARRAAPVKAVLDGISHAMGWFQVDRVVGALFPLKSVRARFDAERGQSSAPIHTRAGADAARERFDQASGGPLVA